jgi:hypothetical protein
MRRTNNRRATALAGVLLLMSPWVLGYEGSADPLRSSLALGAGIILLSVFGLMIRDAPWQAWGIAALGMLAVAAPFALSFETTTLALLVHVQLGLVTLALTATRLLS